MLQGHLSVTLTPLVDFAVEIVIVTVNCNFLFSNLLVINSVCLVLSQCDLFEMEVFGNTL